MYGSGSISYSIASQENKELNTVSRSGPPPLNRPTSHYPNTQVPQCPSTSDLSILPRARPFSTWPS